jgi:hypothetical protein
LIAHERGIEFRVRFEQGFGETLLRLREFDDV